MIAKKIFRMIALIRLFSALTIDGQRCRYAGRMAKWWGSGCKEPLKELKKDLTTENTEYTEKSLLIFFSAFLQYLFPPLAVDNWDP